MNVSSFCSQRSINITGIPTEVTQQSIHQYQYQIRINHQQPGQQSGALPRKSRESGQSSESRKPADGCSVSHPQLLTPDTLLIPQPGPISDIKQTGKQHSVVLYNAILLTFMYYEIYKVFYVSILLHAVFIVVVNFLNDVVHLFKFFVTKFSIRKWIILSFVVCFLAGINWTCGLS